MNGKTSGRFDGDVFDIAGVPPGASSRAHDQSQSGLQVMADTSARRCWTAVQTSRSPITSMLAHVAHKADNNGQADVMRLLADQPDFGTIAHVQGPFDGDTALHDAAWHGHEETVRVLLDAGVRRDLEGCDGKTATELARYSGHDGVTGLIKARDDGGPIARLVVGATRVHVRRWRQSRHWCLLSVVETAFPAA